MSLTTNTEYLNINDNIGNYFIVDEKFADQWFVIDGQNFVFDGQKVKLYEKALEEF